MTDMETLPFPATQVFDMAVGVEDVPPAPEQLEVPKEALEVMDEIPAAQPDPNIPNTPEHPKPEIPDPIPNHTFSPATQEMMFGGQVGGFQSTTILLILFKSSPTCFQTYVLLLWLDLH